MIIKLYTGYHFSSKAMFADGIHSLLDVTADLFVLYAISMSNQPKDDLHPYGYTRYETLANIVISLMLLVAAYAIIHDAVLSFFEPMQQINILVGGMAFISITLNEISYQYVSRKAKMIKSDLLLSTAVHQRADAATSLVVLFATVASFYDLGSADIFGALIIALMIAYYAIPSLVRSTRELLDRGIDVDHLHEIRQAINCVPGVISHHFLRSRLMAEKGFVDVHVVVSSRISVSEGHYIGDAVEAALLQFPALKDVIVHIDAEDDQDIDSNLPNRVIVEEWVKNQGIQYNRLVLHYLNNNIEVEVYTSQRVASIEISNYPHWLSKVTQYYE